MALTSLSILRGRIWPVIGVIIAACISCAIITGPSMLPSSLTCTSTGEAETITSLGPAGNSGFISWNIPPSSYDGTKLGFAQDMIFYRTLHPGSEITLYSCNNGSWTAVGNTAGRRSVFFPGGFGLDTFDKSFHARWMADVAIHLATIFTLVGIAAVFICTRARKGSYAHLVAKHLTVALIALMMIGSVAVLTTTLLQPPSISNI